MGDYPDRPSRDDRKRLDAALNEILIWVCDNLADGWEIQLTMTGGDDDWAGEGFGDGEASLALFDPEGKKVSAEWDGDSLNVWDMVDHSRNPEGETEEI